MDIKRKNIPDGMRDMIGKETEPAAKLGQKLCGLYAKRGFEKAQTPALEYYDVFNFKSQTIPEENMFKLTDKSGRLVVLRPDNTTPMARIAATRLKNAPLPIKLYYNQNVYRVSHGYSGKRCEFTQTGIEIIGGDRKKTDIEALITAIRTLREISAFFGGNIKYNLEIGHAGFCKALLDSMDLERSELETVRRYVGAKSFSALDFGFDESDGAKKAALEKIRQLPRLYGSKEVLDKAREISQNNEKALDAVNYISEILDILEINGLSENVSVDMAIVNDMEYYTGLVFRGYIEYAGEPVLGGGRYDNLLSNFDIDAPATGFGVNLSVIADKLTRAVGTSEKNQKTVLVHYSDAKLLSRAVNYIENCGDVCTLSCFESLEAALEYAKSAGIEKTVEITSGGIREVTAL